MIEFSGGSLPTPIIEIERCTVAEAHLVEFLRRAEWGGGLLPSKPPTVPISYALALRRGHGPEVSVAPDAFAIHGGHEIELVTRLSVGRTYVVKGCVDQIFEKTGRSGLMTMVGRRVWIHDESTGTLAATIRDRQIVRWRPQRPTTFAGVPPDDVPPLTAPGASPAVGSDSADDDLEVGDLLGPFHRPGLSAHEISSWAGVLRDREVLFHDPRGSQHLGYANLVVPGPLQTALVDRAIRLRLPAWTAVRLDMTFRQSLLADQPLVIEGVVVDSNAERRTCEIIVRRGVTGDITSAGSVTLVRRHL
jgi:hypothetical protein